MAALAAPVTVTAASSTAASPAAAAIVSSSLADWISNSDSAGILDTRPVPHWLSYRLISSCNIPLEQLATRSFELPDHHRSFAVIALPCDHQRVIALLKLWTNIHIFVMIHDHMYTIPTTSASSATTVASSSSSSYHSLLSDPFWQCAHELKVIEYGSSATKPAISSLMFAPCSLLSDSITTIERLLLTRDRPSPTAAPATNNELHWRAIDLGCGAGRDVIYLARRSLAASSSSSSSSHVDTVSPWHVVALDQAIDRCEATSSSHGVTSRVTCVRARFKTDGTFIMMPPVDDAKLAAKRRTASSQHNTVNDMKETSSTPSPAVTAAVSSSSPSSIASNEPEAEVQGSLMADGRRMRLANSKPRKKDKSLKPSQAPKSSVTSNSSNDAACESPLIACMPVYDLVLMIRFLERALLPRMRSMVRLGGFVCIANFMVGCESFGHPRDPHHILQHGELATFFSNAFGFTVITDERVIIADGRPMNHFLAQRTSYPSSPS